MRFFKSANKKMKKIKVWLIISQMFFIPTPFPRYSLLEAALFGKINPIQ